MDGNPEQRRRHTAEFKAKVLATRAEPGASAAAVTPSSGLNDNLVRHWHPSHSASPAGLASSVAEPAPESSATAPRSRFFCGTQPMMAPEIKRYRGCT
jgi:transposase-like protein